MTFAAMTGDAYEMLKSDREMPAEGAENLVVNFVAQFDHVPLAAWQAAGLFEAVLPAGAAQAHLPQNWQNHEFPTAIAAAAG